MAGMGEGMLVAAAMPQIAGLVLLLLVFCFKEQGTVLKCADSENLRITIHTLHIIFQKWGQLGQIGIVDNHFL